MTQSNTATLAKTTRPALVSSVVARERLFAWLDGVPSGAAVWIHGGPGCGKTCLLASYAEQRAIDTLW